MTGAPPATSARQPGPRPSTPASGISSALPARKPTTSRLDDAHGAAVQPAAIADSETAVESVDFHKQPDDAADAPVQRDIGQTVDGADGGSCGGEHGDVSDFGAGPAWAQCGANQAEFAACFANAR